MGKKDGVLSIALGKIQGKRKIIFDRVKHHFCNLGEKKEGDEGEKIQ